MTYRAIEVPVEIAGEKHILKFLAGGLARYEMEHGGIGGIIWKSKLSFGEVAALLVAGLWHENRRVTIDVTAELLEEHVCQTGGFLDVALKVLEAAHGSRFIQALRAPDPKAASGDSTSPREPSPNGSQPSDQLSTAATG